MDDIAKIAAGMSEAQREWVKAMPTIPIAMSQSQYFAAPSLFVELDDGKEVWLASGKASKPVGEEWFFSAQLNATGLAVRDYLRSKNDGE